MTKIDRIISQGTSGRWILTVIAGGCLLMITFADCKAVMMDKELPFSAEAIFSVITMVFMSYFNKNIPAAPDNQQPDPKNAPHLPQP